MNGIFLGSGFAKNFIKQIANRTADIAPKIAQKGAEMAGIRFRPEGERFEIPVQRPTIEAQAQKQTGFNQATERQTPTIASILQSLNPMNREAGTEDTMFVESLKRKLQGKQLEPELAQAYQNRMIDVVGISEPIRSTKPLANALGATGRKLVGGADNLMAEAKKFKTADEFVKAQGIPLYHGTKTDFSSFQKGKMGVYGEGNYFYTNPEKAKEFAGKKGHLVEGFVPEGKYATDKMLTDGLEQAEKEGAVRTEKYRRATEILKEKGYIGIKDADIVTVFDADSIKTKSQLTDIWNKANSK